MRGRFSERHGYTEARTALQHESMDTPLRKAIWNVLYVLVFKPLITRWNVHYNYLGGDETFASRVWIEIGGTVDTLPSAGKLTEMVKRLITKEFEWFEVYDAVELITENLTFLRKKDVESDWPEVLNSHLEQHMAAYRLVGGHIVATTSETDIQAIEDALTTEYSPVAGHLSRALELLSDRDQPDYRNSVKESISAVESLVQLLSGKPKASIRDALKAIDADTHPAMTQAFNKLYGYTSDADGIRHSMLKDSTVDQADAMFMLVACSAFVNYLTAKSAQQQEK